MKTLADYRQADGWFKSEDGCDYETATDLLQCGMLDFCGCGSPEENLDFIRTGLELINEKRPENPNEFDKWWHEKEERVLKHFGNSQSAYFFYYWLDKEEYTEHGGSVPGWLTEKGLELLGLLNEEKQAREA